MAFENLDQIGLDETWYIANKLKQFGSLELKDSKKRLRENVPADLSSLGSLSGDLDIMHIIDFSVPCEIYKISADNTIHHIGFDKHINRSVSIYNVVNDCTIIEYGMNAPSADISYWYIKAGINVKHIYLGKGEMQLGHRTVICEERSSYYLEHLQYNSYLSHNTYNVNLIGHSADVDLRFGCVGQDKMENVIALYVRHQAKNTNSNIEHVCIAADKSKSYFIADIEVEKGSHSSVSNTKSSTIFTENKGARSLSRPTLRILDKNIECTHGATCTYLDKIALFYMGIRSIPIAQARRMLINAGIVNTLRSEPVKQCVATVKL